MNGGITLSNEKFNALLKALDNSSTVYLKMIEESATSTGSAYRLVVAFSYYHDTSGTYSPSYLLIIETGFSTYRFSPTSETGLYVPQNIVINEVDVSDNGVQ